MLKLAIIQPPTSISQKYFLDFWQHKKQTYIIHNSSKLVMFFPIYGNSTLLCDKKMSFQLHCQCQNLLLQRVEIILSDVSVIRQHY